MLNGRTFLMVTLFTYCLTFERASTWLVRKGEPVQDRTEFPYIAFVRTERTMCTGSLVSTRAVLTAGHCVCSPMPVVQVSFLTLRNGDQQGIHHQPSGVKVAPEYMPSCTASRQRRRIRQTLSGFDIATVMLAQMVNLQSGIRVISLPQASDIPTPGTDVFIVGYGRDDNDRDPSRRAGGILKKGRATVMECKHSTTGNPICVQAAYVFGQITAPGDSGGPLLRSPQGPVLGVVSHGVTLSNRLDVLVEYASVARMLGFVSSNI
ncbi:cercarial elastase (S01 family) [Schistosoma mansoni]|uniref:Cercarial elastase (S01 family) n=1 Tax=Schistosoma mansoni TaxID=6183 RepID=G4M1L3_SCHMA|nr:cercarial elastase (S01 family) [Schistosoma mansoni]|eukprot:XP_018647362.1 cercarial elastase (S01 family) [Schistosoma mansoni]